MAGINTNDPGEMPDPSDFSAYEAWRDAGGTVGGPDTGSEESEYVAPATGEEEELPSEEADEDAAAEGEGEEPAEGEGEDVEADETGAESETAEEAVPAKPSESKIDKRFRKMTNRIAELTRELEEVRGGANVEDEAEGEEAASTPPPAAVQDETPLVAPKLGDFGTFEEWQAAYDAYQDAKTERKVAMAKAEAVREKEQEIATAAQEAHQVEWNRNASRFADFNEVVTNDVKISHAMAHAMHVDTEKGTRIAYYLGKHPDVARAIAEQTLASNPNQWPAAVARAGVLLGEISAKLDTPATKSSTAPRTKAITTPPPGTKPATTKTATAASRPPAPIRGQAVPSGKVSTLDPALASDFKKWEKAREKEIAAQRR